MPNQNIKIIYGWKRASQDKSKDTHKIIHDCRGRNEMKAPEQINDGASTPAARATETHCYFVLKQLRVMKNIFSRCFWVAELFGVTDGDKCLHAPPACGRTRGSMSS
ncbi:hypothetical protein EVAR_50512_1 [Eumeta japonica]|uniref:Uncharacterized protein n=1 Tax=Eumeta variegata TaxID=151549 RepID=A0A4C1X9B9_EUMVA|nr:hypothetical protein EVAR_50512_1 [Eumeta japonica]